ncbi:hypothetical protein ACVVIC_12465, partial [Lactococcus lactis]
RDNNHVFLELFALKMIHLLSSYSFLLHFTINQVLWGTLQQNPLTQVIFYIMTGKKNIEKINQASIKSFLEFGMNSDLLNRAKTLQELKDKFSITNWES